MIDTKVEIKASRGPQTVEGERQSPDIFSYIAIAIALTTAIVAFWLTHIEPTSVSPSPLSGLMALKITAQQTTTYDEAIANGKPTLLEFYADWCTTCQALAPEVQHLHGQYGDNLNIVMLNIDDPQWAPQVQQYQVKGIPHLTFMQQQTLVATLVGQPSRAKLQQVIQQLVQAS